MIDLILSPFSFATMHHFCVDSATKTTVVHEFKTDITETLLAASFPGLPHRTGGKEDLWMVFYCPWLEQVSCHQVINDSKLRWNRWTIDFNDECKPLTHVWICNQHAQKLLTNAEHQGLHPTRLRLLLPCALPSLWVLWSTQLTMTLPSHSTGIIVDTNGTRCHSGTAWCCKLASFPGPRPASRCLQYGKAGEGLVHFLTWVTSRVERR